MSVSSKTAVSLAMLAGFTLSACVVSPEVYETEPVELETATGVVTCQLYTDDLVLWDRSIDRPEGMSVTEADAICKAEGERRAKGEA